ncbi:MAG: hypothetical protein Q9161_008718 [Pseudevernia consocians]
MSLPANYTAEALGGVNNSTNVTALLESLTSLVQDITNVLPTILAQGQENNRALKSLCGLLRAEYSSYLHPVCSAGSSVMVPSMLGIGVAMAVVLVVTMIDHFAQARYEYL